MSNDIIELQHLQDNCFIHYNTGQFSLDEILKLYQMEDVSTETFRRQIVCPDYLDKFIQPWSRQIICCNPSCFGTPAYHCSLCKSFLCSKLCLNTHEYISCIKK